MEDSDNVECDRRDVLRTVGAGALGALGATGSAGTAVADESSDHYHNPVYEPLFPDPTVVEADGTYYAYASNMDKDSESQERLVPILSSTDLVEWTYEGEALESYPDWRSDDASLWAPDVTYYDGEYRIYYSYSVWGSNENPGIGLATSDTPTGPFTDQGPVFRENDVGLTNCIDAEFHVEDGTPYMIWGSWYGIHGIEMTADGRDYVSGTDFHLAGDRREGAHLVKENGYYYLFYSTGHCCDGHGSDYAVEVGRATSLTGPYYNQRGTDLRNLDSHNSGVAILSGNSRFAGPGHNTTITDDDGDRWMLYHAYDTRDPEYVDGTWRRSLMVDRIEWDDDWPVVACNGQPSKESPRPGDSYDCSGVGPIAEGTYSVENVNSGKVMDVDNGDGGTADGANVLQYGYWGGSNQQWNAVRNGDGTYRFENVNSGKVLAVDGGSTSNGATLVQWSWNGGDDQRWHVLENGDGTYRIENVDSGRIADVYQSSTENGADVLQYDWLRKDNQRWTFNSV